MDFLTKNKKIIFMVSVTIFTIALFYMFSNIDLQNNPQNNLLVFKYPEGEMNFSGEKVPDFNSNYIIKERFDKEFLNTSYNLYQFFLYVKRFPLYMPYIEKKLKESNIPLDFKYLPIAESALRNDVVSHAGAAGIWQFMPDTAKDYGLIVNDDIDERYNFKKSTDAAVKYLNHIHDILGNWTLVAAGYNMGQNGIKNALKKQNVGSYYDLYLNEETSRYVFRILAIKYVLMDYGTKKSSIDKLIGGQYNPPKTKTIIVGKTKSLKSWALENNYNYGMIKNLNMWILNDYLPDGKWEIEIVDEK